MCQYCEVDKEVPYMNTRYAQLLIGNGIRQKRALIVKYVGCPEYARCSQKDMDISSIFEVNYCPNCGRRLESHSEAFKMSDREVVEE